MPSDARKPFLLRIDAEMLDLVRRWADDDLRSLNGQIEYLLRKALKETGRLKKSDGSGSAVAQVNEAQKE